MPFRTIAALAAAAFIAQAHAAPPRACVASLPLGAFQLAVRRAGASDTLPLRRMNVVRQGDAVVYTPRDLPPDFSKSARVSLVLVPAGGSSDLAVLDPEPANQPATWVAPFRVAVVGIVFGPQGLDHKKVNSLVTKDRDLVSQLADYAEQTSQVETLIEALAGADEGPSASRNLEAALAGFASRSGAAIPKLDRTASTDQQAMTLLHALNPALGAYDPLAPQPAARMQQSAGLAASVASLFLGANVGLAAGGAAMVQNLRTLLFPGTDFRSALVQTSGGDRLTLCAKRQPARSRTRLAYLWALRLPDSGPPAVTLPAAVHLPLGLKSPIEIQAKDARLLERARDWTLAASDGKSVPTPITVSAQALEIDLAAAKPPAGVYRLRAKWDWDSFALPVEVHLHALGDLKTAAVVPQSADALIEGAGPVPVKLAGADFEFIERAFLQKQPVDFSLPAGRRAGPQESIEVVVNTKGLKAGTYPLALVQPDGSTREVPVRVLPPNPRLDGLPVRANLGEARQRIMLRGSGLERIEAVQADGAEIELAPRTPDAATRTAFIHLSKDVKKGDLLGIALKVEGVSQAISVPRAIEVAPPRPRIAGVTAAAPDDLGIALRPGELPAGSFTSFSMRVEQAETLPWVRIRCEGSGEDLRLAAGDKRASARLDAAGPGLLFLSLDAGAIARPGCVLSATAETEAAGASDPYPLGRVVRLPRIESFALTDEKVGDSAYAGVLTGQDLETIEKAGWDAQAGTAVESLPRPVAGEGHRQTLRIVLPWPAPGPHAPVYIWLRGETEGRATKAKL